MVAVTRGGFRLGIASLTFSWNSQWQVQANPSTKSAEINHGTRHILGGSSGGRHLMGLTSAC